ncbi:dTDP-4-dehydrorhamnose reductase family protein [Rickettsia prowazekii]|uniref:dTDP-4-dehydrorhamnose reductase n=2 Tax=Rickettsia prowazekii TaxID=782 RepID=Q9ZDJ6_RICPR|nr:NAD(P)-dependent oxidoreductase [Rickettsia prowazekii]EOB09696.1 dTDP-4-dehydrorhamnose reductase [Rickettsia prowazekii str. GvF12]ADE29854.1 dTDP-4-dehydrorhamnose reductase [Rickettsia prowazekii str. Rp22]AFE49148.1 dTDP-4-dehydrorhamnose reductase [Rickettsia prowazekii str. Chernikova]AFE49994.1 dTDP-4-dehydrorhamnose reductase [Rickettsia prowazekii str. Katsinyian]AFE50838.1 dTDP-4-dehydrorhamnose reductase [Rickettsia prowazekii str. BuV67-CWPP]
MKILILGVTGMLGNSMFRFLTQDSKFNVCATARSNAASLYFSKDLTNKLITNVDVENHDSLVEVLNKTNPDVVINCIGLVKQLADVNDPLKALPINSLLPHRLANLCGLIGSRLIHISTDCVFSGKRGNYKESDFPDCNDLYGRSKFLGEVDYPHAITLRTSIIGHELASNRSLINWFLSTEGYVKGFTKAIYSGFPTVEFARIIRDFVLPNTELHGLYHVASHPINKFDLLKLVAEIYNKEIEIIPSDELIVERSLDSTRFNSITGYKPPEWRELVKRMYEFR